MTAFYAVMLLIMATIAASMLYHQFPRIPLAFYQILAGFGLSFVPLYHHFDLEPEIFMLMIIAPLMFYDGQSADGRSLTRQIGTISSMAVVLAMMTVTIVGVLAHSILPMIPLALTFALAAIVTPTDAVAVSSITAGMAVPEKVMAMLESESLFNDASGIVAFDLALSAFLTGNFSVASSVSRFVVVFFGGLFIGLILGVLAVWIRLSLVQSGMGSTSVVVPFNLLVPFAIYLGAEALGLSGILAVVAAGLVFSAAQSQLRLSSTQLQIVGASAWQMVTDILNGFVFVLLGATLPTVWDNIATKAPNQVGTLLGLSLMIYLLMTGIRYLWIRFDAARIHPQPTERRSFGIIGALAGTHGTITLAMAFSLPLTLPTTPFPLRNALIFVAAGVIILSLLTPSVILPVMLPPKQAALDESELQATQAKMVTYAATRLAQEHNDHPADTQAVIEILDGQRGAFQRPDRQTIMTLMTTATEQEGAAVEAYAQEHGIPASYTRQYLRMAVTGAQIASNHNPFRRLWHSLVFAFKRARQIWGPRLSLNRNVRASARSREARAQQLRQQFTDEQIAEFKQRKQTIVEMELTGYKAAVGYLNTAVTPETRSSVAAARRYFNVRHRRFSRSSTDNARQNELFIYAFQYEYNYVQQQLAASQLSPAAGHELYAQISADQMVYMQSATAPSELVEA